MTIYINGRFLAAPNTGVQRVARALVSHLDQRLARASDREDWRLLHPVGAEPLADLSVIRQAPLPGPPGQLWEQVSLAAATRDGILINLANTAPLAGRRSIVMIHDAQVFDAPASYSRPFRLWYRFMLPRICRRAARVLSVSRHSADRLAANGVVADAGAVSIVPNGVDHIEAVAADPNTLSRRGLGARPFLLAFASAQPHKNTQLLLQIAAAPRLSGFDLALVGDAMPGGAVATGAVKLLGRVSDAELKALYAAAFAFLLPSTTEGFGLPAGEAMLCQAPVIVSGAGALGDVWGGGAMIAAPDRPDAWIAAIGQLELAEIRAAQARAGWEHARTLTWDAAAGALLHAINGVRTRETAARPRV